MSLHEDIQQHTLKTTAERAISALVPFWDALQGAGQVDDYQAITEALRVIQAQIKANQ